MSLFSSASLHGLLDGMLPLYIPRAPALQLLSLMLFMSFMRVVLFSLDARAVFMPLILSVATVGALSSLQTMARSEQAQISRVRIQQLSVQIFRRARPYLQKVRVFLVTEKDKAVAKRGASPGVMLVIFIIIIYAISVWVAPQSTKLAMPEEGREGSLPSLQRPLIFLHVPGSGGISFRKTLQRDATKQRATRFLPCYSGLPCAINTDREFNRTQIMTKRFASELTIIQREMRCATVIAGHFKMSLVGVLEALDEVQSGGVACPSRNWNAHSSSMSGAQYAVIIVLRHPLQRIISHFYRFGAQGIAKGTTFGNLTAYEAQLFLRQSGEHLVLSYLVSAKISAFADLSAATYNALTNMKKCTVGIFEHWDETVAVVKRQNPWMSAPSFKQSRSPTGSTPLQPREDPSSLNPLIQGVLINRLVAEMFLFENALQKFHKQLRSLKPPPLPNDFNPSHENYYRHFVPAPFPFQFS
jgi:hypothetical protein